MVQSKTAMVWFCNGMNLEHKRKYVVSLMYKDLEISTYKEDLGDDYSTQNLLIRDVEGEYYDLGIAYLRFTSFEKAIRNEANEEEIISCEEVYDKIKNLNLAELFKGRLDEKGYFNKCELQYISKYFPELYNDAVASRENILNERKEKYEQEERQKQDLVKETNDKFKEELEDIKEKIVSGGKVNVHNHFSFYKDDDYNNGVTKQNSILYLVKQYGIKIPPSTQGFINYRLISYNFETGEREYFLKNGKQSNVVLRRYLDQVREKVIEEQNKKLELDENKDDVDIC